MSHQLLQRGQLLWEVTQSCPVQFQPSQAAHTLDVLWEVPTLRAGTQKCLTFDNNNTNCYFGIVWSDLNLSVFTKTLLNLNLDILIY